MAKPGTKPKTTAKPQTLKVGMIDLTHLEPKNKNFNSTLNSAKSKLTESDSSKKTQKSQTPKISIKPKISLSKINVIKASPAINPKKLVTLSTLLMNSSQTPKLKIPSTGGSPAHLDSLNPLRKSVKVATVNLIADSIVKKPKPSTSQSSHLSSKASRKLVSSIRVIDSAVPSLDLILLDDQDLCL